MHQCANVRTEMVQLPNPHQLVSKPLAVNAIPVAAAV
jgi:hypothetical protein